MSVNTLNSSYSSSPRTDPQEVPPKTVETHVLLCRYCHLLDVLLVLHLHPHLLIPFSRPPNNKSFLHLNILCTVFVNILDWHVVCVYPVCVYVACHCCCSALKKRIEFPEIEI